MSISEIKSVWKEAWESPVKRMQLIIIAILVPVFLVFLPFFFNYIQTRTGPVLNDWLLSQVPAYDVSIFIFTIIWGMIALILYRSLCNPDILITYCLTLTLITVARITCISLVSLSPPKGFKPLMDPLSGIFYGEAPITKDLFFSGHMATLATIFFSLRLKNDKIIGGLAVIAVAVLLVVQHVHYTIDILAAPCITYMCYLITQYFLVKEPNSKQA